MNVLGKMQSSGCRGREGELFPTNKALLVSLIDVLSHLVCMCDLYQSETDFVLNYCN